MQEQLPKQDAVSAAHSGRPIVLRKLQQQGMDPAVRTVVETPQEFLDAVEQGALNIELRANLDMTTVKPRGTGEQASLLNINSTTPIVASSIRVRIQFLSFFRICAWLSSMNWSVIMKQTHMLHPFLDCQCAKRC